MHVISRGHTEINKQCQVSANYQVLVSFCMVFPSLIISAEITPDDLMLKSV